MGQPSLNNCFYCGYPLRELYPSYPFDIRWGHTTLQDAERCALMRPKTKWPHPAH